MLKYAKNVLLVRFYVLMEIVTIISFLYFVNEIGKIISKNIYKDFKILSLVEFVLGYRWLSFFDDHLYFIAILLYS